ncbi:hypothetical protein EV715DRAFT_265249 [Schizophyllum commune]
MGRRHTHEGGWRACAQTAETQAASASEEAKRKRVGEQQAEDAQRQELERQLAGRTAGCFAKGGEDAYSRARQQRLRLKCVVEAGMMGRSIAIDVVDATSQTPRKRVRWRNSVAQMPQRRVRDTPRRSHTMRAKKVAKLGGANVEMADVGQGRSRWAGPWGDGEKEGGGTSAQLQTPAFSADTLVFDEPAEGRTYYCNMARTLSPRGRVPLGRPSRLCALLIGTLARVPHTHTAHSALLLASIAMLPGLTCCPNLLRRMDGPDTLQRVRRHRHSACALHWLGARQRPGTLRILIDLSEEHQKWQDRDYVDPEMEEAEQDAVAEFYQPVQLPTEQEEAEALCAKFGWQTKQFLLGESNDFDIAQAIGLTHDGQHLVTFPNASDIPKPLPNTRVVRMRRDGRFGPDDPMYRPVFYCESYPHLVTCGWSQM